MAVSYRKRRFITFVFSVCILLFTIIYNSPPSQDAVFVSSENPGEVLSADDSSLAINALKGIPIKGRAPKTGYARSEFGSGWVTKNSCDMRNIILNRDLYDVSFDKKCNVTEGILNDPYTGTVINFYRGTDTSSDVQIDHVVALGDAWQKGAQLLSKEERVALANDPLELLAVSGESNQDKGDGDAATWLPPNKVFRCQYVSRQIAVKQKYKLWVTQAEYEVMTDVLKTCPNQILPKSST